MEIHHSVPDIASYARPQTAGTSAQCRRLRNMEETRTEKISVNLTPSVLARLDRFADAHVWPRSTAAAVLIERGLDAKEQDQEERSR